MDNNMGTEENSNNDKLFIFNFLLFIGVIISVVIWMVHPFRNSHSSPEDDKRKRNIAYIQEVLRFSDEYYNLNGTTEYLKDNYSMDKDGIDKILVDSRKPLLKATDITYKGLKEYEKVDKKLLIEGHVDVKSVYVDGNKLTINLTAPLKKNSINENNNLDVSTDFLRSAMVASDVRNVVLGSLAKFGDRVDIHVTLGQVIKDKFNKDKFVSYKELLDEENKIYSEYIIKSSDFRKIKDFKNYTMRQLNMLNQVKY